MGEITDTERPILQKFKESLTDLDLNSKILKDVQLIRWLRARDLNILKSEEMLRNHLQWRTSHQIDDIVLKQIPPSLRAEFPFEITGEDKKGNILVFCPYGKMDLKKGITDQGKQESRSMAHYHMETVFQKAVEKSDDRIAKRFSIILDVEGLTYGQFASVDVLDFILYSLQTFEKNYPETLETAFVLHAPLVWSVLFSLTKHLVHKNTQAKLKLIGSDFAKIRTTLLEYVDEESLPKAYKGSDNSFE